MSIVKNHLHQWLDNASKNAPAEFLRKAANQVLITGYLSLGDFFDNTSDFELDAMIVVLQKVNFSNNEKEQQDCKVTIEMLCDLICVGSGITNTEEVREEHYNNLVLYFLLEAANRKYKSDKELRALRLKYSIEIFT